MLSDKTKVELYNQAALRDILSSEVNAIEYAKQMSAVKQWFLANGLNPQLVSYFTAGVVRIGLYSYDGAGRVTDAGLAAMQRKLKKATFQYEIQGVK